MAAVGYKNSETSSNGRAGAQTSSLLVKEPQRRQAVHENPRRNREGPVQGTAKPSASNDLTVSQGPREKLGMRVSYEASDTRSLPDNPKENSKELQHDGSKRPTWTSGRGKAYTKMSRAAVRRASGLPEGCSGVTAGGARKTGKTLGEERVTRGELVSLCVFSSYCTYGWLMGTRSTSQFLDQDRNNLWNYYIEKRARQANFM